MRKKGKEEEQNEEMKEKEGNGKKQSSSDRARMLLFASVSREDLRKWKKLEDQHRTSMPYPIIPTEKKDCTARIACLFLRCEEGGKNPFQNSIEMAEITGFPETDFGVVTMLLILVNFQSMLNVYVVSLL